MSISALLGVVMTPFLLPCLVKRYGTSGLLTRVAPVWLALALSLPVTASLALGSRVNLWLAIAAQQILKNCGHLAVP